MSNNKQFGSKVYDEEYLNKYEDDNETTFELKCKENKQKIRLGYLEDYLIMLKEHDIGHIFKFNSKYTYDGLNVQLLCIPAYTDKDLDEPNMYHIRVNMCGDYNIFILDIYNKKIIHNLYISGNNNPILSDISKYFENIFRE